jgi:hypothetical protein
MTTKFKIIETEEYFLAISGEEVKLSNDNIGFFLRTHSISTNIDIIQNPSFTSNYKYEKVIAYKPKGNAPKLDLPLLPDVEEDVEKLAIEYANLNKSKFNNWYGCHDGFIAGYKAATKKYSEEDLRKAIEESISWWVAKPDEKYGQINTSHDFGDEFIQSLKISKPKWFVAEIDIDCTGNNNDGCFMDSSGHNCGCLSLKTATINNKIHLVGTYLN